jgi:hypothetical protein
VKPCNINLKAQNIVKSTEETCTWHYMHGRFTGFYYTSGGSILRVHLFLADFLLHCFSLSCMLSLSRCSRACKFLSCPSTEPPQTPQSPTSGAPPLPSVLHTCVPAIHLMENFTVVSTESSKLTTYTKLNSRKIEGVIGDVFWRTRSAPTRLQ